MWGLIHSAAGPASLRDRKASSARRHQAHNEQENAIWRGNRRNGGPRLTEIALETIALVADAVWEPRFGEIPAELDNLLRVIVPPHGEVMGAWIGGTVTINACRVQIVSTGRGVEYHAIVGDEARVRRTVATHTRVRDGAIEGHRRGVQTTVVTESCAAAIARVVVIARSR